MVCLIFTHNRQIQAAVYTFLMTIGVDTEASKTEICLHGDIIKRCKLNAFVCSIVDLYNIILR
jgi:hypothetical protein